MIFRTLMMFVLVACAMETLAATIKLSAFETYQQEDNYLIDASFDLALSEDVLDALKHGIPIQIHTDCEVRMIRHWYPDKTVNSVNYVFQLLHQPLTEDYLTINLKTGLRESYDSLSAALNRIGELASINLISHKSLAEKKQYMGRIRMYLNLDSLPTPLRPQVYFSSSWDISSDWHEWVIKE